MRILFLNVNAITGSTGKIVTDIKNVLEAKGHECLICYGANDNLDGDGYKRICSEPERKLNAVIAKLTGIRHGYFTNFSFYRLRKIIESWHPDVVHIHCPNGYILNLFKTLEYLATHKIKTVLTNHAEYFYTGGCNYAFDCKKWTKGCHDCNEAKGILGLEKARVEWNAFKRAFDVFERGSLIVTSVSPWIDSRVSQSPLLNRFRHLTVLNGLDTDVFKPTEISDNIKNRLPIGRPLILHVTANFTTNPSVKGGNYLKEIAIQMPGINFVVVSLDTGHIDSLPKNVFLWGKTNNQKELAELYNAADLTILTSQFETFSMIVAESLCCGTPVVGFKACGPESIGIYPYSKFVKPGDFDLLFSEIRAMLGMTNHRKLISEIAKRKYAKEVMANNYLDCYKSLI